MAPFAIAAKISDIPKGTKKMVTISGKQIMVVNIDGHYFAMEDACTHAGCSLGTEGLLDGSVITCGCHGGKFDVTNGQVVAPPPQKPATIYKVNVVGDNVMVAV